jgi:hypothetical protein
MQEVGFEPTKALSHRILSPAPLTTWVPLHNKTRYYPYKKLYKPLFYEYIEDCHSSLEIPVPFPNTEVKQATL